MSDCEETDWMAGMRSVLTEWLLAELVFIVRCYVSTPFRVWTRDLRLDDMSLSVGPMVYWPETDSWLMAVKTMQMYTYRCLIFWNPKSGVQRFAGHCGLLRYELRDGHRITQANFSSIHDLTTFKDDILVTDHSEVRIIRQDIVHTLKSSDPTLPLFNRPTAICASQKRVYVVDKNEIRSLEWTDDGKSLKVIARWRTTAESYYAVKIWVDAAETKLLIFHESQTISALNIQTHSIGPLATWNVTFPQLTFLNGNTIIRTHAHVYGIGIQTISNASSAFLIDQKSEPTPFSLEVQSMAVDPSGSRLLVVASKQTSDETEILEFQHFSPH